MRTTIKFYSSQQILTHPNTHLKIMTKNKITSNNMEKADKIPHSAQNSQLIRFTSTPTNPPLIKKTSTICRSIFVCKSFTHIVNLLKIIRLDTDDILVSLEIVSLFTVIPVDKAQTTRKWKH